MKIRVTRKEVEERFKLLKIAMRKNIDLDLEYIACYGGFQITAKNGSSTPFGPNRYKPREMHAIITAILHAIKIDRGEIANGSYWPS